MNIAYNDGISKGREQALKEVEKDRFAIIKKQVEIRVKEYKDKVEKVIDECTDEDEDWYVRYKLKQALKRLSK